MLTIGSLFSGIGGLELGLGWAGFGPVLWQVELNPFCRRVLARHWPEVPRYADVQQARGADLAVPGLLVGGFPCQDVSAAGNRAGLAGSRSGLWREFLRIASELGPEWIVVENVASGARLWVDRVCSDLAGLGYQALPVPLSAAGAGLPHLRRRVFVVAHINSIGQPAGNGGRREETGRAQFDGQGGIAAHADGGRREGEREPQSSRVQSASGDEPHGLGARRPAAALEPRAWQAESPVCRGDHGVPDRLDRLRALGNAVVPQCAEIIGWMIREMMNDEETTN